MKIPGIGTPGFAKPCQFPLYSLSKRMVVKGSKTGIAKPFTNVAEMKVFGSGTPHSAKPCNSHVYSLSKWRVVKGSKTALPKSLTNVVETKVSESGTPALQNPAKSLYTPCPNGGLWGPAKLHYKTLYKRYEKECFPSARTPPHCANPHSNDYTYGLKDDKKKLALRMTTKNWRASVASRRSYDALRMT